MIHQILLLSARFKAKFALVFVLTLENAFSLRFHFKTNGKSSTFERLVYFYVKISRNFEPLQYFNFETNFLENENLFKKLEYRFLAERTKIGNASFLYKSVTSEVNDK